jgi:hypothetical protein
MSKLSIAIGIAIGSLALGQVLAAPIQGAGASSCERFLEDIKDPKYVDGEHLYASWALGYISRRNIERENAGLTPVDLTPGSFDYDSQRLFLRQWCESRPKNMYYEATVALWNHILALNGVA